MINIYKNYSFILGQIVCICVYLTFYYTVSVLAKRRSVHSFVRSFVRTNKTVMYMHLRKTHLRTNRKSYQQNGFFIYHPNTNPFRRGTSILFCNCMRHLCNGCYISFCHCLNSFVAFLHIFGNIFFISSHSETCVLQNAINDPFPLIYTKQWMNVANANDKSKQ